MPLTIAQMGNWIAETSSTSNDGDLILTGIASNKAITFNQVFPSGGVVWYSVSDVNGTNREAGFGVFIPPNTIQRTNPQSNKLGSLYDDSPAAPIQLSGGAVVSGTLNAESVLNIRDNIPLGEASLVNPSVTDDTNSGYQINSLWTNTVLDMSFILVDDSVGAAVWVPIAIPGGTITDHLFLTNIGINTHAQIDTHVGDITVHFTEGAIDHANISNIGTNSHVQLDTHLGDPTIHFAESSVDHLNIANIGTNNHAVIDAHIGDAAIHFTEASIDHAGITNIGINSHPQLDTHVADATTHFTEASIDHTAIANIGVNTHAQLDTHLADVAIHFTEASIVITESQVSDLQNYMLNLSDDLGPELGGLLNLGVHGMFSTSDITIDALIGSRVRLQGFAYPNVDGSPGDVMTTDGAGDFSFATVDHTTITNIGVNSHVQLDAHLVDVTNPHATSVDNLSDSVITVPVEDQVLEYDGANWVNGRVYGSHYAFAQNAAVQTTILTVFQSGLLLNTPVVPAGTYEVSVSYAWNHDATTNDFEGQFLEDGIAVSEIHKQEPKDSAGVFVGTGTSQRHLASKTFVRAYVVAGAHSYELLYRTDTGGVESSIWDATITFKRVL